MEELCEQKKALVNGIARRYFLTDGSIDDLVQEGMIGLYKAILSYDETRNDCFDAYASMCVQRQILDAIRTSNRSKNKALTEGICLDAVAEAAGGPMPEEEFFRNQQMDLYLQAKETLSAEERLVLDAYLKGDSYREISEKFNLDVKKTDNLLQKIKHKIKRQITEQL